MEHAGAEDMCDDVERKGLGTPATRADMIEKLVWDGFIKREKKQMIPSEDGIKLIPEGTTDYSYTKDGKEIKGFQYKVKLEFLKKKK